jgi:hypothetical protein
LPSALDAAVGVPRHDLSASNGRSACTGNRSTNRTGGILPKKIAARDAHERNRYDHHPTESVKIDLAAIHLHLLLLLSC